MKRVGDLWRFVASFANLTRAAGKDQERQLCWLQEELGEQTYQPGAYRTFQIREPKRRLISAAPFRDRVVHHALCAVLEPIFEKSFIADSYACRKGKGTHAAVKRFNRYAGRFRYVFKGDIAKYFPSIDHEILKATLARKIKDRKVLWLANLIIDRSNAQEDVREWFAGDDLFTPAERRRGLPLGNQTSQFFANVYLDPFDHFVKEVLRAPGYLRYVDDFVLFHDDKRWLAEARERCRDYLASLRLKLHASKAVISRTQDGTRFLGYRVFPTHRLLPKENLKKLRARIKRLRAGYRARSLDEQDIRRAFTGWLGHALQADTFHLRESIFRTTIFRRGPVGRIANPSYSDS